MRAAAVLFLGAALTGCAALPGGPPAGQARLGGAVVVAGPAGYCVDPSTIRDAPDGGFALIAACRNLPGGEDMEPVDPVIVTVTVAPPDVVAEPPTAEILAGLSDAALIEDRSADESTGGLVLAHLDGVGPSTLEEAAGSHWRGAFLYGDRLVGLALYAPERSPLAGPAGGAFLQLVQGRIVTLSDRATDPVPEEAAQAARDPASEDTSDSGDT